MQMQSVADDRGSSERCNPIYPDYEIIQSIDVFKTETHDIFNAVVNQRLIERQAMSSVAVLVAWGQDGHASY
jgi:hypothetical protein